MVSTVYKFDEVESRITGCDSRNTLFKNAGFIESLFGILDDIMPNKGILSLDVFDTLVLRDNSSEITRFIEIGERMAEAVNANIDKSNKGVISGIDAFIARYLGTKASYRASYRVKYCREGSLREIHRVCSTILCGTEAWSEQFVEIELSYEADHIIPNKLLLEYIRKHKKSGGRVVLVSDMYMHADQIELLLSRVGITREYYDALFSSADTKVSKASGGIFPIVEEYMEASSAAFLHLGDSFKGDFRQPRVHGWSALQLPVPRAEVLLRREDHLRAAQMIHETHGIAIDIAMPA